MSQSHHDHLGRQNSSSMSSPRRTTEPMAQSIPQRLRNDESWVEISSQPSSSSLSSIGDEIVTTGLRVQHTPNTRRRRGRVQPSVLSPAGLETRHTGTSSQEEYDESESEEDQVMTSSNEQVAPPAHISNIARPEYDAGSDSDDDDENATALGKLPADPVFTPQPNAFSHPPSSHSSQRTAVPGTYFPQGSRPAYPHSVSRPQHSSHNNASTPQAEHDAALRASLTTLLSIGAAAARGLPKRNQTRPTLTSNDPVGLRIVPESELLSTAANASRPISPSTQARSSPSISSQEVVEKGKRKASAGGKVAGEKGRAMKKKKVQLAEGETMISPTLLTWVMSAGVVVLVSVVGFGAGYVIGREVGRQEVLGSLNGSTIIGEGGSCGREVASGSGGSLRRFKWGMGGGAARSVVA